MGDEEMGQGFIFSSLALLLTRVTRSKGFSTSFSPPARQPPLLLRTGGVWGAKEIEGQGSAATQARAVPQPGLQICLGMLKHR